MPGKHFKHQYLLPGVALRVVIVLLVLVALACARYEDDPALVTDARHNTPFIDLTFDLPKIAVESEDTRPFFVARRTPDMVQYPCATCHTQGLKIPGTPADYQAHADIRLEHAQEKTMDCATCHGNSDTNKLNSLTGSAIDMDRADELCGQCHTEKKRDWLHGAHGKRYYTWQGTRVIQSCTSCHNPHKPALEKRMPVAFPELNPRRNR